MSMKAIVDRLAGCVFAIALMMSGVNAQTVKGPNAKKNGNELRIEVDSVDFRTDLTRVYCRLIGRPHTANRIDYVTLRTPGVVLAANEIDGVDFERYFQWEDEGVIPVELDFAPSTPANTVEIEALTVYGTVKSMPAPLDKKGRTVR